MQLHTDLYSRFIPDRLVRRHLRDPAPPVRAQAEVCRAAVLLADITGFTVLTERYSQRGDEGIEQLKVLLNEFFGQLNTIIFEHGGDIISFAGDAVLALWPADGEAAAPMATRLAARCGLSAQHALDHTVPGAELSLRMHIVVAEGDVTLATVGGHNGLWEYVATGTPIAEAGLGLQLTEPGNVVLAPAAWNRIAGDASGRALPGGYVRVATVRETPLAAAPPMTRQDGGAEAALRSYIAKPVLDMLDAGHADWLGEFRRVSAVFVAVQEIDYRRSDALARLQAATVMVQVVMERYEGGLQRVLVDDKETNVMCVWGIPGRLHEDDAARAVSAALDIHAGLRRLGIASGVGITTGRGLCGLTGGGSRYDYTVAGDVVNLAARLMVAARDGVLCDLATRDAARGSFDFETCDAVRVKGRDAAMAVVRPRRRSSPGAQAAPAAVPVSRVLGRDAEIACLRAMLSELHAGISSVVAIEGEAGVGKSRLVGELQRAASQSGTDCLIGHADAIEINTTYLAWRPILCQILSRQFASDPAGQRRNLEAHFDALPALRPWLPLLNDVLPLGFPESPLTAQMGEQARAGQTSELLLQLLCNAATRRPTVIVLEDAHWLDSMSWSLASQLQRRASPLLLVLVMRSGHAVDGDSAWALLDAAAPRRITLAPLSRDDTASLVCDRLGVTSVPAEAVALIHEKTDGHPLFSEELTHALRDRGYLRISGERCDVAPVAGGMAGLNLPANIEGIIAGRIDRLAASEQLTLKVASVAGRAFELQMVSAVHPLALDRETIAGQFRNFAALDLVRAEGTSGELRYQFKHAITQEVTYGLLPFAQRRQLHRDVAGWIETAHAQDPSAVYPLLAHHWSRAGDPEHAFGYLHKAGEQAFRRYANREAADFLQEALSVRNAAPEVASQLEHASCERLLGFASLWLGDLEDSRSHIQQALALLGRPIPSSWRELAFGVMVQSALSVRNFLLARRLSRRIRHANDTDKDAAESLIRLSHIYYFMSDTVPLAYTSLRCLNFAERAPPSREVALIYAALASGAAAAPMHWLARRYSRLALEAAEEIKDAEVTSQVLLFVSMYGAGIGDWRRGLDRVGEAQRLSRSVGDIRRIEDCQVMAGFLHYFSGDFDAALECYQSAASSGHSRGDRQTAGWGLLGVARVRLAQGRTREALDALRQATPLAADRLSLFELQGQTALAHFRLGEWEASLRAALAGLGFLLEARPVSFATMTGTTAIAETLTGLWQLSRAGKAALDATELARQTCLALRALQRFARVFPIGSPRARLQQGIYHREMGRPARAMRLWHRALDAAARLDMPFEEASIALVLAHEATGDARAKARGRADRALARLGISEPESMHAMSDATAPDRAATYP